MNRSHYRSAFTFLLALGVSVIVLTTVSPVAAQEPARQPGSFRSLDELNASYRREMHELNRRRIKDLATLAATSKGAEADAVDAELFRLAVAGDLCAEANPAAERCLASKDSGQEVRALATYVQIIACADRGDFDRSFAALTTFLKAQGGKGAADCETALGLAEAYRQRLIRAGRYDIARQLCEFACESKDAPAALKAHFEARMDQLKLLGKAAPPLEGTDADGAKVSLAGLKGKVVLIDFWATWCPPNVAAIPRLNALAEKYQGRGFEILGVNVDGLHEDVGDAKKALPVVRRFLVTQGVSWTSLIAGGGASEMLKAYGVSDIPASFLIDREGKVIAINLPAHGLEQVIEKAIGR